jgi:hypothetical protein
MGTTLHFQSWKHGHGQVRVDLLRNLVSAGLRNLVSDDNAPLVVPVDADRGEPLVIQGAFVLLTDPLTLTNLVANWAAAGVDIPPLATVVIESDDQFDAFVATAFLAGQAVLVDPLFDLKGDLVSAHLVDYFDAVGAADE